MKRSRSHPATPDPKTEEPPVLEGQALGKGHARGGWALRVSIAGLLVVLGLLAGFAIVTQMRVADRSRRADEANQVSEVYQDARFWVSQEESLERKYRLEPGADVLALHEQAEQKFVADLHRLLRLDDSPTTATVVDRLLRQHTEYVRASDGMFRAVDARYAIGELRRHAGSQFDPSVTDALCDALTSLHQSGNSQAVSTA